MERKQGGFISWLGLIIAIVALIVAWSAYNRAGVDLSEQIEEETDEYVEEVMEEDVATTTDGEMEEDDAMTATTSVDVEAEV